MAWLRRRAGFESDVLFILIASFPGKVPLSCSRNIDIAQAVINVIVEDTAHGLIRHKDYFELLRCE